MSLVRLFSVLLLMTLSVSCTDRGDSIPIAHPIKNPPKFTTYIRCDNCGMDRNRFARTRYVFDSQKGRFYTCSIACLVILSMKKGLEPFNVRVAEYLQPVRLIEAEKAVYVIGSKARGTMTRISKIAFSRRADAEEFVNKYGGRIATFKEALEQARAEILREVQQ